MPDNSRERDNLEGANLHFDPALTHPSPDASASIKLAESSVTLEWSIGDVILDLYEVDWINQSGAWGS